MTESQYFWYMICQWFLTIATIVLAAIALWGHIIRQRWLGPKLKIDLRNPKGEFSRFNDGVNSRYFHLSVYNVRRSAPAHNVRLVIKEIYRPQANNTMSPIQLSGPIQLQWQYPGSNPQFQTIGAPSICDFGFLRQNESFRLCTLYQHISFNGTVGAGEKMIVHVIALSDETESNLLKIEITWDGIWSDNSDEMTTHLVVKEI